MDLKAAIQSVIDHQNLSRSDMTSVMKMIMGGEATPAQLAGFLVGLRMKGETVDEIAAAATVMRDLASQVEVTGAHVVDTCGTGGDGAHTFNISTASAFVVAAAGGKVAKHGNRSVTSSCGSADVLERAGVNLALTPSQVAECVEKIGVGFMFAPRHHSAMKHVVGPRREMGVRTLFNLLGPLTNPAKAKNQVLGVFTKEWVEPLARVLGEMGSRHVMVVHAEDGLDEISIGAPTTVAELREGKVSVYTLLPADFGINTNDLETIKADDIDSSWHMMKKVLAGNSGPAQDIVALNGGAAIYVSGLSATLAEGVQQAFDVIRSGAAGEKLQALVNLTVSMKSDD